MKKITVFFLIALFLLQGCFSIYPMPGDIHETKSEFDGATEISMKAAWAVPEQGYGHGIQFEPYWRSTMPKGQVALILWVMDTVTFSRIDPVRFNIDGEIVALNSEDRMQHFYEPGMVRPYVAPWSKSGKRFVVSKSFLEKIFKANRVVVRIDLENGYEEATFSSPTQSDQRAKKYMQEFYNRIFPPVQI